MHSFGLSLIWFDLGGFEDRKLAGLRHRNTIEPHGSHSPKATNAEVMSWIPLGFI